MEVEVNKNSLVVQANELVEAKYRLSVEEQKIIRILISQIQRNDVDFKEYKFRIKNLAELLEMGHNDIYRVLPRITERLISRVLKFYNPKTKTLLQTSWLSSAEYHEGLGTVALCFDPKLKPLLLQIQTYFTQYELGQVLQFKGQYTIRFFEIKKSFLGRTKKPVIFTLEELRETLGLKKSEYQEFFNFKTRVLESARLELLEKTGKSFVWEPIREGRGGKITAIRFIFTEDNENTRKPALPVSTAIIEQTNPPAAIDEPLKTLIDFGIIPSIAQDIVTKYDQEYIDEKAAIVTAHPDHVKNKAGFLITALQENWKDAKAEEKKRLEEAHQKEREKQEREQYLLTLKKNFDVYAKNHALKQYERLPQSVIERIKEEYLESLPPILRKRYVNKPEFGFEDHYYRGFLVKEKITPVSLEEYLQHVNITLSEDDIAHMRQL